MQILANLGKLADGRTALVIKDAYDPNYAIVSNFDDSMPMGEKWDGAIYFDGNFEKFSKAVLEANTNERYNKEERDQPYKVEITMERTVSVTWVRDVTQKEYDEIKSEVKNPYFNEMSEELKLSVSDYGEADIKYDFEIRDVKTGETLVDFNKYF